MVRPAVLRVESFELPSYILQHQTHLEGRVGRLEMRAHIRADRERRIALVDRIDGLERYANLEQPALLACVHDVDQYISCPERSAGQVSVLVRILHSAIIEVMDTDSEIVGLFRRSFTR